MTVVPFRQGRKSRVSIALQRASLPSEIRAALLAAAVAENPRCRKDETGVFICDNGTLDGTPDNLIGHFLDTHNVVEITAALPAGIIRAIGESLTEDEIDDFLDELMIGVDDPDGAA